MPENGKDRGDDLERRLAEVNKRLGRDTVKTAGSQDGKSRKTSFGNAFQLSSEFIAAILVGAIIGYGIDWLLGTLPWGLILFFLLGFVAGVMNVMRAAGELAGPGDRLNSEETEGPVDRE